MHDGPWEDPISHICLLYWRRCRQNKESILRIREVEAGRAPLPSIQGRPEGRLQISMCSGLMSHEWMAMSRSSMSMTLGFRAA